MAEKSSSQATILEAMSTFPDNADELAKVYDKWAKDGCYDKDVSSVNKRGSEFVADELEVLFPENRAEVRILDAGAGSGRTAEEDGRTQTKGDKINAFAVLVARHHLSIHKGPEKITILPASVGDEIRFVVRLEPPNIAVLKLRGRGFTNMDALDPSQGMLDLAMEKQLYHKYTCDLISEKPVNIPDDTYDAVVSVGATAHGHLPAIGVIEFLRLTKIGGVAAIVGSATEWNRLPEYSDKMTKLIKQLEEQGRLNVIKWTTRPDYMFSGTPDCVDGIIIIVRKL